MGMASRTEMARAADLTAVVAADQVTDLTTFLHAAIYLNANRRLYQVLDIVTGDPKAGGAFFRGGWAHTGDLVRRDREGLFYYEGRRKEMIRRGGVIVKHDVRLARK